jgi:prepilin-type N-terminal cleavage/methylation domain-containing protein
VDSEGRGQDGSGGEAGFSLVELLVSLALLARRLVNSATPRTIIESREEEAHAVSRQEPLYSNPARRKASRKRSLPSDADA